MFRGAQGPTGRAGSRMSPTNWVRDGIQIEAGRQYETWEGSVLIIKPEGNSVCECVCVCVGGGVVLVHEWSPRANGYSLGQ